MLIDYLVELKNPELIQNTSNEQLWHKINLQNEYFDGSNLLACTLRGYILRQAMQLYSRTHYTNIIDLPVLLNGWYEKWVRDRTVITKIIFIVY